MLDIYVKNLTERTDRWERIVETYKDFKNINLIRVESIKNEIGYTGNFLTTQKCINIAKEKNLKNILIIEDDCIPLENESFENKIISIKKYLDDNDDWSMFLGAGFSISEENIIKCVDVENSLYEISKSNFAHMICINYNTYDLFLNAEINEKIRIPFYWHNKINCLISIPFLVTQFDGYSSINQTYTNHDFLINYQNDLLKKYVEKNLVNNSNVKN